MTNAQQRLLDLAIWVLLLVATLAVYSQVGEFDFVEYDDGAYVFQNAHVQAGLTPASMKWALTAVVSANWMPVTLLSHIIDGQLFGMQSGLQHLENVLLHGLASGILFLALRRATGSRALGAFVAFMFALHPLHVASVAWISERKDVLAALFWFWALYAYIRYTEQPSWRRYGTMALLFALGLMSKPMLVTFPFTLLLIDIWPLRRTEWARMLWEKLPLVALTAVACIITYLVQGSTGAFMQVPLVIRIANSAIWYITYIRQMLWPTRLAFFYPYPHAFVAWKAWLAAALLLIVTTLAILMWRSRPYIAAGWFWYLGTLVPIIGLVQVGMQSHADRYMYIPMVGLLLIVAGAGMELTGKWPVLKPILAGAVALCCVVSIIAARQEVVYWENSETLFGRALEVTRDNWVAEYNLGTYLARMNRVEEAAPHFAEVVRINPDYVEGHHNFGVALLDLGDPLAAADEFEIVLRANPTHALANYNLGRCEMATGDYAGAVAHFEAALRARPDYSEALAALNDAKGMERVGGS